MSHDDEAIERITWLWRLAKGWLPQALGTTATAFSIVWGSYGTKVWTDGIWAGITALALLAAAVVAQAVIQRPSYMKLAERLRSTEERATQTEAELKQQSSDKSAALDQAMQVLLRKLSDHCKVDSNDDRVSIYYFHDERFVLLSRYALHPEYRRRGRAEYPVGQGAIGRAWTSDSVAMTLPHTRRRWEQTLRSTHGYSEGEANALTMQCQSIAALRVEVDHQAVGVLVFESVDPNRVSQKTLETARDSMLFATLGELVAAFAMLTTRGEELASPAAETPREERAWKPSKAAI